MNSFPNNSFELSSNNGQIIDINPRTELIDNIQKNNNIQNSDNIQRNIDNIQRVNKSDDIKIKKISIFTKMSNSVSKRPRFHLALIILLVLIIIIILIYYRGLLFIGPFCKNNMKNKEKNNEKNNEKIDEKNDDPITEKLINSINK